MGNPFRSSDQPVSDQGALMSTLSSVALALKPNVQFNEASLVLHDLLKDRHDLLFLDDGSRLFVWQDIKWNVVGDDHIKALYHFLNNQDPEDFLLVEVCYDHPLHDADNLGSWKDNPWSISKVTSVQLSYDESVGR